MQTSFGFCLSAQENSNDRPCLSVQLMYVERLRAVYTKTEFEFKKLVTEADKNNQDVYAVLCACLSCYWVSPEPCLCHTSS